jgi:hypothetical protein
LVGTESRSSLGTDVRLVEELRVVEVLGSLIADSRNSPVSNSEATGSVVRQSERREVISILIRRVQGNPRSTPLSSSDVIGGAVLCVLSFQRRRAAILIEVISVGL